MLGTLVIRGQDRTRRGSAIRARSFELVNEEGRPISYWGVDGGGNVVLTFAGLGPVKATNPAKASGDLKDSENQMGTIGVLRDDSPFLVMKGRDGKERVRVMLSLYGKPFLLMDDGTGPRVKLGFEGTDTPSPDDNDWSLIFKPEVVRIGFHAQKTGGQTCVEGGVFVQRDKVVYPPK